MSLAGNLKTVNFADILQLLSAGKKTGILQVNGGVRSKEVAFREGNIIYASAVGSAEDMLGSLLLKRGRLSKEDLERAIVMHKQSGRALGETLIDMKVFSSEEVSECLRMQVEEIVYNLFSWPEGEFDFKEGAQPVGAPFLLEMPTMSVIMEGTRRIDEWVEIQKVLPSDDVLLKISHSFQPEGEDVSLSLDEFRILPLISGERSVPQIIDLSPIGEFPSYRALYKLIVSGHIEAAGRAGSVSITGMENEEEVVLQTIFYLYNNCLCKVRSAVCELFGENSPAAVRFFEIARQAGRSGLLTHFSAEGWDPSDPSAFDRFYAAVIKIPAPIRLHSLMSALESYLSDQLELLFRFLGSSQYRGAVSQIKKEISAPLASRRELVKRYQIDENFYSALHRAERMVKTAIG